MNKEPLFTHRFKAARAADVSPDALRALAGELCAARGVALDATAVIDTRVSWKTDESAAESVRAPLELAVADVQRATRRLLVFTARVEPSLDALRAHAERFADVPLCALAGYALRCAPPKKAPARIRSSADVQRDTRVDPARLSPRARQQRSVLDDALDGGGALFDRIRHSEPVAVQLLAEKLEHGGASTVADWRAAVLTNKAFRLLLIARGYVRRGRVRRRAELLAASADGAPDVYLLPADQLGLDDVDDDDEDDDDDSLDRSEDSVDEAVFDWTADVGLEPVDEPAAPAAPHALDPLETLPLDTLCWYECERAARDRLSVLLSICAHHECVEHAAELPNARHVNRYPHGPGAPVAATGADAPGALGSATGEQYAALGCALLAAAAAGDAALERWLLYAEALVALHRAPHAVDEQLAHHVSGVDAAIARARPRDGAVDGAHELLDELRTLMRDAANLEFDASA